MFNSLDLSRVNIAEHAAINRFSFFFHITINEYILMSIHNDENIMSLTSFRIKVTKYF